MKENNIRIENWLGHEIRFVELKQNDWWAVAKDVTEALGIKNTSLAVNGDPKKKAKGLRDSEKGIRKLYTLGGEQEMLVVNEPGIYRLIFRSNKPEAEAFQDWVFDILKLLRQSAELEGFQIFRTLDKEHQREEMSKLSKALRKPGKIDFIKANTIANKAISTRYGHSKMVKKGQMTPEMLVDREPILEDTVDLMGLVDKFELPVKVSEAIYQRYAPSTEISINK